MELRSYQLAIFATMFLGYACYAYNRKSVSFALPELMAEGLRKDQAGMIVSSQNLAYAVSKFLGGVLSDRLSARLLFSAGLVLSGLATLLFGACPNSVALFSALWFLNGLAQGCGWPSCAKVLRKWYAPSQFGTWWSVLSASANISGGVAPFLSAFLIVSYGWRFSLTVAALPPECSTLHRHCVSGHGGRGRLGRGGRALGRGPPRGRGRRGPACCRRRRQERRHHGGPGAEPVPVAGVLRLPGGVLRQDERRRLGPALSHGGPGPLPVCGQLPDEQHRVRRLLRGHPGRLPDGLVLACRQGTGLRQRQDARGSALPGWSGGRLPRALLPRVQGLFRAGHQLSRPVPGRLPVWPHCHLWGGGHGVRPGSPLWHLPRRRRPGRQCGCGDLRPALQPAGTEPELGGRLPASGGGLCRHGSYTFPGQEPCCRHRTPQDTLTERPTSRWDQRTIKPKIVFCTLRTICGCPSN
uniref:Putative glucose-6-phosphate translocase isoform 1 n=1 Tax=Ixodes ricinus TaxID=34613 RepID=A0A6B0VCY7_IXORI